MCNDPKCENCRPPIVDIPALIATYCQLVDVIKPFDTFVAQKVHRPGMVDDGIPFYELVVKKVFDNGQVVANLYGVTQGGKRIFSQAANFAPPHGLKQMIHKGLFIPQSFFLQFTQGRVVHEIDQSDLERGQAN